MRVVIQPITHAIYKCARQIMMYVAIQSAIYTCHLQISKAYTCLCNRTISQFHMSFTSI